MTFTALWLTVAVLMVAAILDWRAREVPDWLPALLLTGCLLGTALGLHRVGWWSLLGGLAIAFALGALLFWLNPHGFGGGDVKLLAALGAVVGHRDLLPLLFWIALAGGVLALIALLRGKRDFAYVPAMLFGLLVFVLLGELRHVLLP